MLKTISPHIPVCPLRAAHWLWTETGNLAGELVKGSAGYIEDFTGENLGI